jgi:hypothetical protein
MMEFKTEKASPIRSSQEYEPRFQRMKYSAPKSPSKVRRLIKLLSGPTPSENRYRKMFFVAVWLLAMNQTFLALRFAVSYAIAAMAIDACLLALVIRRHPLGWLATRVWFLISMGIPALYFGSMAMLYAAFVLGVRDSFGFGGWALGWSLFYYAVSAGVFFWTASHASVLKPGNTEATALQASS